MNGNHLGSLWIRPDQSSKDDFKDVLLDPNSSRLDESIIAFPFRPIQREFEIVILFFSVGLSLYSPLLLSRENVARIVSYLQGLLW
jgi:hypothetical protein